MGECAAALHGHGQSLRCSENGGCVRQFFYFSDYPVDHPLHSEENKKVLGKFKDEMASNPIHEYVGLRAKMCSIVWEGGCTRTCKGISRQVNKKLLEHEMYKNCLFERSIHLFYSSAIHTGVRKKKDGVGGGGGG